MTETSKLAVFLSIEHDQRIDLTSDGQMVRGHETYIREYVGMLDSGLMAQLSNAAYKVLHALALRARILGDARRAGSEEEFQELRQLGIVTDADKGELFCFPSREQLLRDTGIGSVHTIDTALDELAELHLVRRITLAQPRFGRGFFGPNIYLIHSGSFIGKFDSATGKQTPPSGRPVEEPSAEQKVLPAKEADGKQKLLPAEGTESSLRNTVTRALKRQDLLTTTTMEARAQSEGRGETAKLPFGEMGPDHAESYAQLLEGLGLDEPSLAEMESLLLLVADHSNRLLSRAEVRRWKALADEFAGLARARGVTPTALLHQVVHEALDAGSAREGYLAPKLARAILRRWANRGSGENRVISQKMAAPKREIPPSVRVYRDVRRRFPAQELWEQIAQTVGADESSLTFWQEVLTTWVARGYNPLNVEGPLQWFKAQAIPLRNAPLGPGGLTSEAGLGGTGLDVPPRNVGADAPQNGQNVSPALRQRPIERLEVIQERLRQNNREKGPTEPVTTERTGGAREST